MADGDPLSATAVLSTGPTSGDLCQRVNDIPQTVMGVKAANGDGAYFAILNSAYETDNHSIQAVLAATGPQAIFAILANPTVLYTTLYLHCDTGHTIGAYCRVFINKIEIGSFTRSGSVYTYTPFASGTWTAPTDRNIKPGDRIEFRNMGTVWYVQLNGVDLFPTGIVNASLTLNSTRRTAAISIIRATISSQPKQDSFWVYSAAMSDWYLRTYVGSGAKMSRPGTGSVTMTNTASPALFPASYFTNIIRNTADIIVDPATAKFTVSVEGWYSVKLRHAIAAITTALPVTHVLFKNGAAYELGQSTVTGSTANVNTGCASSWTVYLLAGDYVQAGYIYPAIGTLTNGFGGGDANSTLAYMTISLLNRSLD